MPTPVILIILLLDRMLVVDTTHSRCYYYPHFSEVETEAQGGCIELPEVIELLSVTARIQSGSPVSRLHANIPGELSTTVRGKRRLRGLGQLTECVVSTGTHRMEVNLDSHRSL